MIFNGDNYTPEWHAEAQKRGLPNLRNPVEALPVILRKDTVELFTKYKVLAHHAEGDPYTHAKHARDILLPAMASLRTLGDKLETLVADDLWPLPSYREMLFIK